MPLTIPAVRPEDNQALAWLWRGHASRPSTQWIPRIDVLQRTPEHAGLPGLVRNFESGRYHQVLGALDMS
jgi:hypothetical protein